MKIFLRIAVTVIVLSLVIGCGSAVYAHTFRDVNQFDEAIDLLNGIEVIKGYSSTSFGPNDDVTRWQMALLISKLVTGEVRTDYWEGNVTNTSFTDLISTKHYLGAINYAHREGIIIGRDSSTFDPDSNITVQEGLTMVVRALGYPRASLDNGWPSSYITKARELGLLEGLYNLSYTATMTRGQSAQMLYNVLFAETNSGKTLASTAFNFIDTKIILAATENFRLATSISFAPRGKLVFAAMSNYGKLTGDTYTIDASLFNFDNPDDYIGVAYNVVGTKNLDTIMSLTLASRQITRTDGLSVASTGNTISLGGTSYTVVSSLSYSLTDKVPTNKEIIVYALNDDVIGGVFSSGELLSAQDMAGTTGYYAMAAYDDNDDGYPDRIFYKPYSFGQYKLDTNNRIAIADDNRKTDIDLTGANVTDGDYVLFSFDSQSKTLDIAKVFTKQSGTIESYAANTNTIKIDNYSYTLGTNIRGADSTTVSQPFASQTSLNNRKIDFYADDSTQVIYHAEIKESEMSLSGNLYNYIYMVMGVNYTFVNNNYYPTVYLSSLGSEQEYIVASVDGTTANTGNIQQLLSPGDVVEVSQNSSSIGSSGLGGITVSLNLTKRNNAATYTTSVTNSNMFVHNNVFYIQEGGKTKYSASVNANTYIYVYSQYNQLKAYTLAEFMTEYPYIIPDEGDTTTEAKYGLVNNQYLSVYIGSNAYSGLGLGLSAAHTILIRPFDYTSFASTTGGYNTIVYVPSNSNYSTQILSGAYWYVYNTGFDIGSGAAKAVYSKSIIGGGFYKAMNDFITDTTPVITDISNTAVTFLHAPVLSSVTTATGSGGAAYCVFQIGGVPYYIPKENIRIYVTTSTGLGGMTISSHIDSANPNFDYSLNFLSGKTVSAIFMNTPTVTGFYDGIFYIVS